MFARFLTYLAVSLALGAGSAVAQDPLQNSGGGPARNFGGRGEIAFSSDASFVIQHASGGVTSVEFAPAADVFVIDNLSIGGAINVEYVRVRGEDGFRFSVGPRIGYNYSFTNLLSIWPKLGFAFAHSSSGYDVPDDLRPAHGNNAVAINLFVPVMLHPATHFFVGFGPFLDADLSGDHRTTAYGLKLTIGGWMN